MEHKPQVIAVNPPVSQLQFVGQPVELYISCENLGQSSTGNKVVVKIKDMLHLIFEKIGKTEKIMNNSNPTFTKTVNASYCFEMNQILRFTVKQKKTIKVGGVEVNLAAIMGSKNLTYVTDIYQKGTQTVTGRLTIRAVPQQISNTRVSMKVKGHNIPAITLCFCCPVRNYYLQIMKVQDIGGQRLYSQIYKSDTIIGDESPSFKQIVMMASKLCNSNYDAPILFKISNITQEQPKVVVLTGQVERTINQLRQEKRVQLVNPLTGENAGTLEIAGLEFEERPSFISYLQTGWQLSMGVCIDFTGSKDLPSVLNSLHLQEAHHQYEGALTAIGSILEQYVSDKSFPVYGFGRIPQFQVNNPKEATPHCFPLNGNNSNHEIHGMQAVVQTYRENLMGIAISGPTYFAFALQQIITNVKAKMNQNIYNVYLILADGEIFDLPMVKNLIVEASTLPLSLIIVGFGPEKYQLMEELDGDSHVLRDTSGKTGVRDIVQYVKFKKFASQGPAALSAKVLKEIPDQVVNYMIYKGMYPPGFQH